MVGDDAPHDSQPQPWPRPDILGRVERLEDVDLRLARYPTAVINYLDYHARAFHVRPDSDASASVHSVYGVVDQGVLQAGDHIDLSYNRPVHVGVLLHRPDQMGDASYASLDLAGQADEIQRT